MADTGAGAARRVLEQTEEPVLVWAVTEEIVLANDAALSLLAAHGVASRSGLPSETTFARALARIVEDPNLRRSRRAPAPGSAAAAGAPSAPRPRVRSIADEAVEIVRAFTRGCARIAARLWTRVSRGRA
jgi:hypothetical protein